MEQGGLDIIERELQQFPVSVLEEFHRARDSVRARLADADLQAWGQEGVTLAQRSVRAWEAASEYFRVSPPVLAQLPFPEFLQWAQCGSSLCHDSPTVSVAFFRASPNALGQMRPRDVASWASLGRVLYKGTWKSSALSARFFELSPDLFSHLSFRELELFVALVDALSYKSYDLATECLYLGQQVFPAVDGDREALIALAMALVEQSWREVRGCFEAAAKIPHCIDGSQRVRFLLLAERMARKGVPSIAEFLLEGAQALDRLERQHHRRVIDMAEVLLRYSPTVVAPFLKTTVHVRERLSDIQFEAWFTEGLALLRENVEAGSAYFRLESARADQVLDGLSASVELERIREVMRMYCQALAGAPVDIQATKELVGKGIGWVSEDSPTTEGTKVFLPPVVGRYSSKDDNFGWFKVVSTHQVAHLEFRSFEFQFDRPSALFVDLRPQVEAGHLDLLGTHRSALAVRPPDDGADSGAAHLTDMSRLFDLFPDRKLALDIFTAVEDGRLDHRLMREYPGIAPLYRRVQRDALSERPAVQEMPLQQAMVECLVRLSLHQAVRLAAPRDFRDEARVIAATARRVMNLRATVEDSAEATLRIYAIICRLPNQEVPPDQWESQEQQQEQEPEYSEEEFQELLARLQGRPTSMEQMAPSDRQEGQPYESPPQVEYRGDFKPEMTQLLSRLKQVKGDGQRQAQAQPLTKAQLEALLERSAELELQAEAGKINGAAGMYANNVMREAGLQPPGDQPGQGHAPIPHEEDQGGPLESKEPLTFVYDEWDFRAADYKPRWCVVREKPIAEGETQFFADTVRSYSGLMSQVRRQFELVIPEMFRKIRPLNEGEDVELDAVIEAMIDKRAGQTPSEKLYWRRNKVERDVAVVFLLDMSASTAEAIDESRRLASDWDTPDDPLEYMIWLRSRRGQGAQRHYKRIIDIEKESIVLLINALEAVGDVYGIYGFSGYGRENVEFYVIKDIAETFSERVKRRIDKITPLHATRMGPAIRHAVSKLDSQDARTKILFLVSDGRPQDRAYSREGVEREYAVHDTKMALTEARRKNITPFCLTVDKAGHDYLKTMCTDMGYEVLSDVAALPKRLPLLYRRLTL